MNDSHSWSNLHEDCLFFAKLPMQSGDSMITFSLEVLILIPSDAHLNLLKSLKGYGSLVWIACEGWYDHDLYPLIWLTGVDLLCRLPWHPQLATIMHSGFSTLRIESGMVVAPLHSLIV